MSISMHMGGTVTSDGATSIRDTRRVEDDWTLVYATYARPILRYLRRLTLGHQGEAEDHLQETFLRTWRWLQNHPLDLEEIRPWLYAVARRIVIDAVRSRKVRPTEVVLSDVGLFADAGDDIERLVQAHALRDALLQLTEEHRATLVQLYYHERTAKEAATVLGIPEGTVKSRAYHGLRALRTAALAAEREGQRRPQTVRAHRRPRLI